MKVTFFAQGRQHRVIVGEQLTMARISKEPGALVEFGEVLMVEKEGSVDIGKPHLEGVKVRAEIVENFRGKKLRVFKMRRRKKSRVTMGHRSDLSRVRIKEIVGTD